MKNIKNTLTILIFTLAVSACGSSDPILENMEPKEEKQLSPFPNLIADSLTWDAAKKEMEASVDAQAAFNKWIVNPASEAMASSPFSTTTLNKDIQPTVAQNATYIHNIAVHWLFMDKKTEQANQYLQKTTILIHEWAKINAPTGHTPVETILTPVYEAYSIIRNNIEESDRKQIDNWIKMRVNYYKNLNLHSLNKVNNWNTIRLNFLFYFAHILDDEMLYNYSVDKLKSHIDLNIMENGKSDDLIVRDAFAYHAYNLLFYSRILKSVAMYKGKEEALNLYQLKNSKGASIKSMVDYWEPYLIDPANNVHMEFVNSIFSGDRTRGDANKPYNRWGSIYVLDELRFIESKCSNYIETITSSNRYGRTFKYWINSVEVSTN